MAVNVVVGGSIGVMLLTPSFIMVYHAFAEEGSGAVKNLLGEVGRAKATKGVDIVASLEAESLGATG